MITLSPFTVYLAMQADKIGIVTLILSAILALISFISVVVAYDVHSYFSEIAKEHRLRAKKFFAASILCAIIFAGMPSTSTIAAMVILPPVANNEHIQALPEDIVKFVRSLIHEHTSGIFSLSKEKDEKK